MDNLIQKAIDAANRLADNFIDLDVYVEQEFDQTFNIWYADDKPYRENLSFATLYLDVLNDLMNQNIYSIAIIGGMPSTQADILYKRAARLGADGKSLKSSNTMFKIEAPFDNWYDTTHKLFEPTIDSTHFSITASDALITVKSAALAS